MKKTKAPRRTASSRPGRFRQRQLASLLFRLFASGLFAAPAAQVAQAARGGTVVSTQPTPPLPVPSSPSSPTPRNFVYAGSASVSTSGNAMTVTTGSRTTGLNWDSFNIVGNASVNFVQPDVSSRVLNRIWDANPSVIMGTLSSNGQIYLINQNGILFGNGAQVNVAGLVASALNVSDDLLTKGLPGVKGDTPLTFTWTGNGSDFANSGRNFVALDPGARIVTNSGSPVVLLAPVVDNQGSISTPGGNVVLAAGGTVLLTAPSDPNLRGLLVQTSAFKGADGSGNTVTLGGTVTNNIGAGIDTSSGGVVSLAAMAVNQQGTVRAGQAINLNGEILLVSGQNKAPKVVVTPTADSVQINWTSSFDQAAAQQETDVTPAGKQTVEIVQPNDKLQIDWTGGFNVAQGQTFAFTQPTTGAIVYNFVNDHSRTATGTGGRSQVNGTLTANGQLMLINEKGIDIGSGAKITASNFVASGLGVNPTVVSSNLLSITDVTTPSFILAPTATLDDFRQATVNVASGASIATSAGGYVLLLGSQVNQGGTITTPSGQTVLAAGAKVYLKPSYSSRMRGFTAEVDPLMSGTTALSRDTVTTDANGVKQYFYDSNRVVQTGTITAAFGDITLVGHDLVQAGTLSASTSVSLNGSIHLLARDTIISRQYYLDKNGTGLLDKTHALTSDSPWFSEGQSYGTLTLAPGSRASITIDGADNQTITSSQFFAPSVIDIEGGTVSVGSGASLAATGGNITLSGNDRVFVDSGAVLDVSGAVAQKSVADLFVEVELRGTEFANNPVQRNGVLAKKTAWVDMRDSVAIADLSAYFNGVGQTVAERAATGGTISISGTNSVVLKSGATLNVSGGQVDYAAATVNESLVYSGRGSRYRLNDAPTDLAYTGLATSSHYEAAYMEGRSAGTISISGVRLAVDATLLGNTVRGPRQQSITASDRTAVPLGGQLNITNQWSGTLDPSDQSWIRFVNGASTTAQGLGAADTAGLRLDLSTAVLAAGGFSRLGLTSVGRIDLDGGIALNLGPGGSFNATGSQIYVGGSITAPGGSISLQTTGLNFLNQTQYRTDAATASLVVDQGAVLSTAGYWSNDYLDAAAGRYPVLANNGGSVTLASSYDIDLRSGSLIDVSGGGELKSNGSIVSGNAGSISLTTGRYGLASTDRQDSSLFLDGTLAGYALGKGGTLSIATSRVRLAAAAAGSARGLTWQQRIAGDVQGVTLTPDFFNRGGFYQFKLTGNDGVDVAPNTVIAPKPVNWSLQGVNQQVYAGQPSGTALSAFAKSLVLDPALRSGTTAVSLSTGSVLFGDLVVGAGAEIDVSPQGSITLASKRQLMVYGTLQAPAGTISLAHTASGDDGLNYGLNSDITHTIWLGSSARLLAGGASVLDAATIAYLQSGNSTDFLLAKGLYKGKVLDGGTVTLDAGLGYVVTETGSLIDVSGVSRVFNTNVVGATRGGRYQGQALSSAGGTVNLAAREGFFLDGTMQASGGAGALGGNFTLSLGSANFKDWVLSSYFGLLDDPRQLTLYQSASHGATLPSAVSASGLLAGYSTDPTWVPSTTPTSAQTNLASQDGKARLDLNLLQNAGFGSWYLQSGANNYWGSMVFEGNIQATVPNQLRLDSRSFTATAGSSVSFSAAAIQLGNYSVSGSPAWYAQNFSHPATASVPAYTEEPTAGTAAARFVAQDIALVGNFLWNGFSATRFDAGGGDIHFDSKTNTITDDDGSLKTSFTGSLEGTGTVNFNAARLYPSTYSHFTVDLSADAASSISITRPASSVAASFPLSAAGSLTLSAASIDQGGSIYAPFGSIVLTAPASGGNVTLESGSITSVAGDRTVLFGLTSLSGREWDYTAYDFSYGTLNSSTFVVASSDGKTSNAPEKSILVKAGHVDIRSGASVDLSGGGEALAHEFVSGPGGTNDILTPSGSGSTLVFAILPGYSGNFAPTDSQLQQYYGTSISSAMTGLYQDYHKVDGKIDNNYQYYGTPPSLKPGDSIRITDSATGVAGTYTLLPASYALLPGAYLVTIKSTASPTTGAVLQNDGSWLTAGIKLAATQGGTTTAYTSLPLTIEVAGYGVVQKRAAYTTTSATAYFGASGAQLPGDAGRLSVAAWQSLAFNPTIRSGAVAAMTLADGSRRAGYGAEVDIAAPRILVTDDGAAQAGWTVLSKTELNGLGIGSLLLGGIRQSAGGGATTVTTIATEVDVQTTGSSLAADYLHAPELLFTAAGSASDSGIVIHGGSTVAADVGNARPQDYQFTGDGAFLRVSGGVDYQRSSTSGIQGGLTVQADAKLKGKSIILDATGNTQILGGIALQTTDGKAGGGAVSVSAKRISVVGDGSSSAPTDGLVFSNSFLTNLGQPESLRLLSYTSLDLYGNALLGADSLKTLTLSAMGIAGHGDSATTATLKASTVILENLNPSATAVFTPGNGALGNGTLSIVASDVQFAGNASAAMRKAGQAGFVVKGFAGTQITASDEVRTVGTGVTAFDGTVAIDAGRLVAATGSDQSLRSSGRMTISGGGVTTASGQLGGKLDLQASALEVTGRIETPSGKLTLTATGSAGSDGIHLGDGAQLLADGSAVDYGSVTAYGPAGSVVLTANHGDVILDAGALVSVDGGAGGDAGTITLSAVEGNVSAAAGTLRGRAKDGLNQGSLVVDAKTVSLDNLVAAAMASGVRQLGASWSVRARSDDLSLAAGNTIQAHKIALSTDQGNIDIYGTLDASGPSGGDIDVYAGAGTRGGGVLTLHDGGKVLANATTVVTDLDGAGTSGQGGSVTLGGDTNVDLQAGGLVDVSVAQGSVASGGSLTLRASRTTTSEPANHPTASMTGSTTTTESYTWDGSATGYSAGMVISFVVSASNSTSTPLVGIGNLGLQNLLAGVNNNGGQVAVNALQTGQTVTAMYDGSAFRIVSGLTIPFNKLNSSGNNAMTFTASPTITAYARGQVFSFKANASNSGTGATTLNISGKGAKPLLNADGSAVTKDQIQTNSYYVVVYDGAAFRLLPSQYYSVGSDSTVVSRTVAATVASTVHNAVTTGTSAYAVSGSDTAYNTGMVVNFKAQAASLGSSTLNVAGLGAKPLLNGDGSVLAAGDVQANEWVAAVYDGTNFRIASTMTGADGTKSPAFGTGVAIAPIASIIKGTSSVIVEANKVYNYGTSNVSLDADLQGLLKTDDMLFMQYASGIASSLVLGRSDGLTAVVRPGVELRTGGNLTLSQDFNLENFRQGGQPGVLTLRAGGNVNINATLSDGFSAWTSGSTSASALNPAAKVDASGDSWSYRIVAGADLAAANPLTTASIATGDIMLASNAIVRTGTGSIDLAAARNIILTQTASGGASIYTAGVQDVPSPSGFTPYLTMDAYGNVVYSSATALTAMFTDHGGSISLTAGQDIRAESGDGTLVYAPQSVGTWLVGTAVKPSAPSASEQWWSRISSFQQGIAVFGGGNVTLSAGGDVSNVTVAIPTNGQVPGVTPDLAHAVIRGGGDLRVSAGGSIEGGLYYVESGTASLAAGGAVAPATSANGTIIYTEIDLGNSPVTVSAMNGLVLGSIYNPLGNTRTSISGFSSGIGSNDLKPLGYRMGTYGENSSVSATSVTGDVSLQGNSNMQNLMPGRIQAVALDGSINVNGYLLMTPQEDGQLDLLARNGIRLSENNTWIAQLDLPSSSIPSLSNPVDGDISALAAYQTTSSTNTVAAAAKHAIDSVYATSETPNHIVALEGSINIPLNDPATVLSKVSQIYAGGDLVNPNFVIQNNKASDVSSVSAGGDITYTTFNGTNLTTLQINGPGRLEVSAGGNIDLGNSVGIISHGNLDNPYLPAQGASLSVIAGVRGADYDGFLNLLAAGGSAVPQIDFAARLAAFVDQNPGYRNAADAGSALAQDVAALERMPATLREPFLLSLFFQSLRVAGKASSYEKGRLLASTLFPSSAHGSGGNIDLFFSQIKTEQGGDIELLAPFGGITVGIANPSQSLAKGAGEQGIFTVRGGDINAYAMNNFLVNQSRVFTLDVGNILVWADQGNIDAGNGAKTVSATPPAVTKIENGKVVLDISSSVSGSGIATLSSKPSTLAECQANPGTCDVDLFAPQGAIDAGDAGLRSNGNITLGARVILNASNIQAAGTVTGAPAVPSAPAPATGNTSTTAAQKSGGTQAENTASRDDGRGLITVEVLAASDSSGISGGFGGGAGGAAEPRASGPNAEKKDKDKKDGEE